MNTITASYNFPTDFLWGINPGREISADAEGSSYLFRLQEKEVRALLLKIPWDKCEPLKGHYDESYIESRRSLMARARNRNIEPVVILDRTRIPPWQNLDHPGKGGQEYNNAVPFCRYLANALVPYANFFGLYCPSGSIFHRQDKNLKLREYREIADLVHALSGKARIGLILPEVFGADDSTGMHRWTMRSDYDYLKTIETDFLGIPASGEALSAFKSLFGEVRKPLMILSDGLKDIPADDKCEKLADNLYDVWMMYQKGWQILGYLSETDFTEGERDSILYEISCKNNAFRISTDLPGLPEKWIRFLKD